MAERDLTFFLLSCFFSISLSCDCDCDSLWPQLPSALVTVRSYFETITHLAMSGGGDGHRSSRLVSSRTGLGQQQQLRHKGGGGIQGLEAALMQAARHQHGAQGNEGTRKNDFVNGSKPHPHLSQMVFVVEIQCRTEIPVFFVLCTAWFFLLLSLS